MLATDILFVGIGQAGNRLTSEVTKKNRRIRGLYINSNEADLKNIDGITERNRYIVVGANGAGRDRREAVQFTFDSRFELNDELNKYKNKKHIYIAFSMGGGTGSGMGPALLSILAKTNPDVKYNVIAILPKLGESRQALINACECWDDLVKLSKININTIYFLDNSQKSTISEINQEFARLFTDALRLPDYEYDEDTTTLDLKELTNIFTAQGISGIYELDNDYKGDVTKHISDVMANSIFHVSAKTCEYLSLVVRNDFETADIEDSFTISKTSYICTTEENPMMLVGGSSFKNSLILEMKTLVEEQLKTLRNTKEESIEDLLVSVSDSLQIDKPKKSKKKAISIDDLDEDELWDEFLKM